MGDVNARNSLFYCFLETPLFLSLYGGNSNSNVPFLPVSSALLRSASNSNCPTVMQRVICSKKRFISAQSHCLTHAQFIKSLGEVRIVVRLGSVKERERD